MQEDKRRKLKHKPRLHTRCHNQKVAPAGFNIRPWRPYESWAYDPLLNKRPRWIDLLTNPRCITGAIQPKGNLLPRGYSRFEIPQTRQTLRSD